MEMCRKEKGGRREKARDITGDLSCEKWWRGRKGNSPL
jgi:hypothetical protein